MIAITTFSQTGFNEYAHKTIQSVVENWPTKLIVYLESEIDFEHPKVEKRNFFDIDGVMNFYQNIKTVPICHGITANGYDYNHDLWKFSRKMFAQWDVLKTYKGKVFWLDADCYVRKPVPEQFLVDLFDKKGLCYLGREGFYTETGFVGFDTEDLLFQDFLYYYMGFIRHGWFMDHKRWHDCEAFDFAREKSKITGNNLSPFFKIPDNKKMTLKELDVFSRSSLGEYLLHAKGKRKDLFEPIPPANYNVMRKSPVGEYVDHKKGNRK